MPMVESVGGAIGRRLTRFGLYRACRTNEPVVDKMSEHSFLIFVEKQDGFGDFIKSSNLSVWFEL